MKKSFYHFFLLFTIIVLQASCSSGNKDNAGNASNADSSQAPTDYTYKTGTRLPIDGLWSADIKGKYVEAVLSNRTMVVKNSDMVLLKDIMPHDDKSEYDYDCQVARYVNDVFDRFVPGYIIVYSPTTITAYFAAIPEKHIGSYEVTFKRVSSENQ